MFSVALVLLLMSCVFCIDLTQPASKVVHPGQSLTITCQVSGYTLTDSSYATGGVNAKIQSPSTLICLRMGTESSDQSLHDGQQDGAGGCILLFGL
ncbi:hypothetical protein CHARACLAT_023293 [Characodon lateralis]|uniref:Immunoglobulin V-set domain-containing protein n=1 Tax=Characodon lateralis TaxID=208331 RepID=A0ABU7EM62_9TELE|nr:hypothetical protein [Characodon lateralis]